MELRITFLDNCNNSLAVIPITHIENMNILHGLQTHRYALHSNLFETIRRFEEDSKRRSQLPLNFEDPFSDSPFSLDDCSLLMPIPTQSYYWFYTEVDGNIKRGIINSKGQILAYANFDDALPMSDDFVILLKNGKFGFANSINQKASDIIYKSLDLQPTLSLNEQRSSKKLAAIATLETNYIDKVGALDENGDIIIPFEYDRIEYHVDKVTVYLFGRQATIPIEDLDPSVPIKLKEDNRIYDDNDPDPWGAKAEMDYIRKNGGDWIDD